MENRLDKYPPSTLKFSSSKLYFQHQNKLMQDFGFISPMSIDIHFNYTFQEVKENYFIEGGDFEGITVDHDIQEHGILYKIGFLHPRFQNIQHISVDLKKNILDNPSIWPFLLGLLGWGVIFGLFAWLYSKGQFWHILFWLNIIGGGILFIFCIRKIIKYLYTKFVKTKRVDYGGFSVNYANQSDALILSREIIKLLKNLEKEYWITKFCYTGNCIYLLQDVHDYKGNRLSSSSELYIEQEKAKLQQKTINYIHESEFLSLFSLD